MYVMDTNLRMWIHHKLSHCTFYLFFLPGILWILKKVEEGGRGREEKCQKEQKRTKWT